MFFYVELLMEEKGSLAEEEQQVKTERLSNIYYVNSRIDWIIMLKLM